MGLSCMVYSDVILALFPVALIHLTEYILLVLDMFHLLQLDHICHTEDLEGKVPARKII